MTNYKTPTIILTSTVNVQNVTYLFQTEANDRIRCYLKSIKNWLYETNLNIVLVENSGYQFNELNKEKEIFKSRFEFISFNEKELQIAKYLQTQQFGKGRHEIFAIHYAYSVSELIKTTNFIIKITCRYYIPEFESFLSCYNLDNFDGLTQNDENRCEIVGSHINNFTEIFSNEIYDEHVESVFRRRMSYFQNVIKCKIFKIEPTQRGGFNGSFKTL